MSDFLLNYVRASETFETVPVIKVNQFNSTRLENPGAPDGGPVVLFL